MSALPKRFGQLVVDFMPWVEPMFFGLLAPSFLTLVLVVLLTTQVTLMAVTVYLHRHSAHRSVQLHPALQQALRFWLWLTTGMNTREWTAIHRKHHAFAETPDDPHSPVYFGIGKVLWTGADIYRQGCTPEVLEKFGAGTPDDWIERHLYTPHSMVGIISLLVIEVLLFGVPGVAVWALQMAWVPFFAAGVVNGLGHWFGYRNFEVKDRSNNLVPLGIFICGEELHNNHHTYPNSAKLSAKPWEFDLGWAWIRLFQACGLAQPLSTGPVVDRVPGKERIDRDTLLAAINDRFRVMSDFSRQVIVPVLREEARGADRFTRKQLKSARKLLARVDLPGVSDKMLSERKEQLLRTVPALTRLSAFGDELRRLLASQRTNLEDGRVRLADWVMRAENSGIQTLQNFGKEIRKLTLPKRTEPGKAT